MKGSRVRRGALVAVSFGAVLAVAGAANAMRGVEGGVNGRGGAPAAGGGVSCAVVDPNGSPTTVVSVLEPGDPAYWLFYGSGGNEAQRVTFMVRPRFTGSPLAGQAQVFTGTGFDNIQTPFGIPFWGLDLTSGPWQLRVANDLGQSAVCNFEVVP